MADTALPPGFRLDVAPPIVDPVARALMPAGSVVAIDGDTLDAGGRRVRVWGADAPESKQLGWDRDGNPVEIGRQARKTIEELLLPGAVVGDPVSQSYGRDVAPVTAGGRDVAAALIRGGNALSAPQYLGADPRRRFEYVQDERLARQNRLGLHSTFAQTPADFRHNPLPTPSRETIAQFWDTPTPNAGLKPEDEQTLQRLAYDPDTPIEAVVKFATDHGFVADPANIAQVRATYLKGGGSAGVAYSPKVKPLTDQSDGGTGAVARGFGNGVLPNLLEEAGAVVDTLGGTDDRENVFNSDRRFVDIWANNESQNEAITGFDKFAHPYATTGAEIAGGLVVPMGRISSAADLAKFGAGYGALSGFGQEGSLPQRLTSGVVGAGEGAVLTVLGGKALEGAGRLVGGLPGKSPVRAPEAPAGDLGGVPSAPEGVAVVPPARMGDVGGFHGADMPAPPERFAPDVPAVPEGYMRDASAFPLAEPSAGIALTDAGQLPPGFTLDHPADMPMLADPAASVSMDVPSPAVGATRPIDQPHTQAQLDAMAADIQPGDVLPIKSNEVGSVEEAAAAERGRYSEAKPVDERTALGSRTLTSANGKPIAKRGPLDLVTWLRTQGGVKDQGGNLRAYGIDNKPRDLDFSRGEQRLGKLIDNDGGMNLDDAALRAWEAGYLPGTERPDINTLLDAIDRTHSGAERHFHPDDLHEVQQFEGLRADRQDLERQLSEGPVHVDRSMPASDDQPFPPVSAYEEWPAGGPNFAGNINLGKLDSPQDIARALSAVNNRVGFDAATRGRVSHAETERLAAEMNMTPDSLIARRQGQAFNAEEALAARQILAKSGNELVNLARRVHAIEHPGDDMLTQFQRALVRHTAIQEQVAGATAEAGRVLSQFRMVADSRAVRGDVLQSIIDAGGGTKRIKDAAGALLDAVETSPGQFNALAEKLTKPRWQDKAVELYYNMLLSGPQTHAANIVSNALTAFAQFPEHGVAAALGLGRKALGRDATDRVYGSEIGSRALGLIQGTREGMREFARVMRTGQVSDVVSKVEAQSQPAIGGIAGSIIRTPTRALSAEDELFKGIARRMELSGLAARQAATEGLTGKVAADRIADLTTNPPDDLLQRSFDYARYLTFQQPLSGIPQSLSLMTQQYPALKLVVPFVRTPTNLLKFAAERSPAAPLLKDWRADIAAGGARRDLAAAKVLVGSGLAAWMADLASRGAITGSAPSDDNKNRLLRANGWQPYSLKIGDTYYSYSRFDPFAMTMGVAADMMTKRDGMTDRQLEDGAGLLVASIMKSLGERTWLSGMSDAFEMFGDPERHLGSYLKRQAASMVVPSIVGQTARAIDPTKRMTDSVGTEIQARLPWASSSLPAQRDVMGTAIQTDRAGPDILSPSTMVSVRHDAVAEALLASGVRLGKPTRVVDGKRLSDAQFSQYQSVAGALIRSGLAPVVGTPEWAASPPDARQRIVDSLARSARRQGRDAVLGKSNSAGVSPRPASPPVSGSAAALPLGFTLDH